MECFLPSEIARMVLGYLKDEGCNKAYKDFLVESAHLHEYATYLKRGVEYPTRIGGKGLVDMLEDYGRVRLYDLHNQPEVVHCMWSQLEQAMTQLKYVLSESQAPEFRTKGTVLNSVMKSYNSQTRAYTHSMLLQKRKNTQRDKSSERPLAVSVGDDERPSTSAASPTPSVDRTLSQPDTPDERCKNPAYSPRSLSEKPHSVVSSRSPSPTMPRITRRNRLDSANRQMAPPPKKRSNSVSSSGKLVLKLSNVQCLRDQREALLRGMRTGIVSDAQRKGNNDRSPGHSPTKQQGATGQKDTIATTVAGSESQLPSDGRQTATGVDGQKSCDVSSDRVEDCCEHAVAMETDIDADIHDDDPPQGHDLELDPQTAPSKGVSHPQSVLKTPVKRLLVEENSRDAFRSPRRKSQAPKRRTVSGPPGVDREVVGETVLPPVSVVVPGDQHSSDSCDNVFSMPVLDELINSRLFAERLAENINRVKLSVESTPADKPASCSTAGATTTSASTATPTPQDDKMVTKTPSPAESLVKVVEKTKAGDDVVTVSTETPSEQQPGQVSLEDDPSMSDAAVSGIIALTQNDPDFDAIFSNLFGIDFSGTDIMGEMTSPSTSAVLSTNQNAADAILQNDTVTKHDFSSSATSQSVQLVCGKPEGCPSATNMNTSFEKVPTASDVLMSRNEHFIDHNREQSAAFSSSVQDRNGMEHTNMSHDSDETKALVPGSFVQIYHVGEDGSTGYYETVQVVSSGDDSVVKSDTNSGDRQDGGQCDTQGDSRVVESLVTSVRATDAVTQYHVTGSKYSVSMTTTDTCSSHQSPDVMSGVTSVAQPVTQSALSATSALSASDQPAMLIMPSGETYILPAGSDIISRLANAEKLQSTSNSQNAVATTNVTHGIVVSETENISPRIEHDQILPASGDRHGNNPGSERTPTNDVDIRATADTRKDAQGMCAVPHTPPTNQDKSSTLSATDDGDHSFVTIDSQALEALRNYDSASPSPAKVTPKTKTRKTKVTRKRVVIPIQSIKTLGGKNRTTECRLTRVLDIKDCVTTCTPLCGSTGIAGSGLIVSRPVTTCPVTMSCIKKTSSFQNTVLSREKWQAKIHDGHWTLVNERTEKRKYLGVPNKRTSQTFKTDAAIVPAAMTTTPQWRCLSQTGALSSLSSLSHGQHVDDDYKRIFSATQEAAAAADNMTGFRIQNGVTTVNFSQTAAGDKYEPPLSFGDVAPHPLAVLDIGLSPVEMAGAYETMSKVASNTAAIKVTCALAKDRSWTADINTVLDLISPKANGAVTKQVIDNDVTQVAWAVGGAGVSSHVRTLNFDLRSCVTNADSGEKRLANSSPSYATVDSMSQPIPSTQHRLVMSNSPSSNSAVVSKCHDYLPSPPIAAGSSEQSANPETQNVTGKTCIPGASVGESSPNASPGNTGTIKPTTASVCTKDGATSLKPRDVCRRPARRVAMKTIKRADEILAERSLARNVTHVAPSAVHNSKRQADKCVVGKPLKTDADVKLVVSSENSAAPCKSVSAVQSGSVGGTLPNGFTTVCESEVAEALVAFATSIVITPVKNPPAVTCIHPSKSVSRDGVTHVDSVTAPKCSTPLGQPPPLSSTASPVSVPCKLMSSTASPVSVQCKLPSSTMSPVLVPCKPVSSTMQCKPVSSTMSLVSMQCKVNSSVVHKNARQTASLGVVNGDVIRQIASPGVVNGDVIRQTPSPGVVKGDVIRQTPSPGVVKGDVIRQTASPTIVNGDVKRPSSCVTSKQGKRSLDIDSQHSVKPKRTRLRKGKISLVNMDVDKFLSNLHAK